MRTERTEWQGDCFAADLPEARVSIDQYPQLDMSHPQTATVFYSHNGDHSGPYRARGYGVAEAPINTIDDLAITWHLERKQRGTKIQLGNLASIAAFTHDNLALRPYAVRIIGRDHYALDDRPDHKNRLTVDRYRNIYEISSKGDLQYLGDLGPRIEVKADDPAVVDSVVRAGKLDELTHAVPGRSYELVLSSMVKKKIPIGTCGKGMPETEIKFSLEGEEHTSDKVIGLVKAFAEDDEQLALLLPGGRDIQRLRRYHLCREADKIVTVVETTSGRLSLKRKQNARVTDEGVLLRTTEAAYNTDTSGVIAKPAEYIAAHGLTKLLHFTKLQRMTFLQVNDKYGTCIRVTYDDCTASNGATLRQLELEFAGTRFAPAPERSVQDVLAFTAQRLQAWILKQNQNISIGLTTTSKADHFLQS